MKATIRLVMLTALRDKLFGGLLGLLVAAMALSVFLGGTTLTEQLQTAVVFAAGTGRVILVLGLTIFAASHIQGLFETREIEAALSRALSRPRFIFAYWIGFACAAVVVAGIFAALVMAMTAVTTGAVMGAAAWGASVVAECVVVLSVTLFAGLMLERVTPTVMFTLGFYALARLMGYFVGIRETATDETIIPVAKRLLDAVLIFMPRLDLFAQTRWLVYGIQAADISFVAAQAALFVALALAAAAFDLSRKQF